MRRGRVLIVGLWLSMASVSSANSGNGLIDAVIGGDAVQVNALLDGGANADIRSTDNQTPLYVAADNGHVAIRQGAVGPRR